MENDNHQAPSFSLSGTLARFEDKMAVIVLADGQEIKWPIKNLPEDSEAGQPIRLVLSTAQTEEAELERIAKTILNQMLKVDGKNGDQE